MVKVRAFRTLENSIRRMGLNCVAGVDEVGRGCLAGPVVAAAVVLNPDRYIPRVCDSKTVTAIERAELYERIFGLVDKGRGSPLPRALTPKIRLESPKITRKLTTEWFAKRVDERYEKCLSRR